MKRFLLILIASLALANNLSIPQTSFSTITGVVGGKHPAYSHSGSKIAYYSINTSTGFYEQNLMNSNGTGQFCVSCTTWAVANLPQTNWGNCSFTLDDAWLMCQAVNPSSTLTAGQSTPGSGKDSGIVYINQAGTAGGILRMDTPNIGGGYLECRVSRDGALFFCMHETTWTGTTAVLGIAGNLRVFGITESSGITLGAPISAEGGGGVEITTAINYISGGTVTSSGNCTLTATNGTFNANTTTPQIQMASVGNSLSGASANQVLNGGSGVTVIPTTWTLSGCGSGTVTTSGGAIGGADYDMGDSKLGSLAFIEGASTKILGVENPTHTIFVSMAGTSTRAFRQWSIDIANSNPLSTITCVSACVGNEWSEMGLWHPLIGTYLFVSSVTTGITPPSVVANVALEITAKDSTGTIYKLTYFNQSTNALYYPGPGFSVAEDFDISPDGTKFAGSFHQGADIIILANLVTNSTYSGGKYSGGIYN